MIQLSAAKKRFFSDAKPENIWEKKVMAKKFPCCFAEDNN